MPMRPGRTGVKSCFSLARVLKTRNGMDLFYQSRRGPCGAEPPYMARRRPFTILLVETGLRANQQLKMVFRSPSMSSSLTPLAGDVLVLDPHHFADALPRVDGFVADLESLHRKGLLTRSAMGGQGWA